MTQIMIYGENTIHVDGYKGILSFLDTEIKLQCQRRVLWIQGERLRIRSFNGVEIEIQGLIHAVSWNN